MLCDQPVERANRALLTIVIQKLSAAARATFSSPPALVDRPSPAFDAADFRTMPHDPCNLAEAVTPFIDDMQRLVGELTGHSAGVHAAKSDLAMLSNLRLAGGIVPYNGSKSVPGDHRATGHMTGENAFAAAELRSTSAFVSGAAQSVEASIAAASLGLVELAEAVSVVIRSADTATDLSVQVERLAQHVHAATLSLEQSMCRIDEVVSFIDKVALRTSVQVLGAAVAATRAAEKGQNSRLIAGEVDALAMQAEGLAARLHECAGRIVAAAHLARAAMNSANGAIFGFNDALRMMGRDGTPFASEVPGIPHPAAAGRSF